MHVWAEHYDRELEDIFELQDEITQTIAGRAEPEMAAAERGRAVIRAAGLDPNFSTAHAYLCFAYDEGVVMGWADDPEHQLDLGMKAARRALQIDGQDPIGYFGIGRIHMMRGEHDASIGALETAIQLNPSFSPADHGLGMTLMLAGRLDEARTASECVERPSPRDPILRASMLCHALAGMLSGDTASALAWAQKTMQLPRAKGYWPHAVNAAVLVQAGRVGEAGRADGFASANLGISYIAQSLPTKHPGGLDPYLDALRAAGLPE